MNIKFRVAYKYIYSWFRLWLGGTVKRRKKLLPNTSNCLCNVLCVFHFFLLCCHSQSNAMSKSLWTIIDRQNRRKANNNRKRYTHTYTHSKSRDLFHHTFEPFNDSLHVGISTTTIGTFHSYERTTEFMIYFPYCSIIGWFTHIYPFTIHQLWACFVALEWLHFSVKKKCKQQQQQTTTYRLWLLANSFV